MDILTAWCRTRANYGNWPLKSTHKIERHDISLHSRQQVPLCSIGPTFPGLVPVTSLHIHVHKECRFKCFCG